MVVMQQRRWLPCRGAVQRRILLARGGVGWRVCASRAAPYAGTAESARTTSLFVSISSSSISSEPFATGLSEGSGDPHPARAISTNLQTLLPSPAPAAQPRTRADSRHSATRRWPGVADHSPPPDHPPPPLTPPPFPYMAGGIRLSFGCRPTAALGTTSTRTRWPTSQKRRACLPRARRTSLSSLRRRRTWRGASTHLPRASSPCALRAPASRSRR